MQRAYPRPCRAWHDRRRPRQCVLLQNGVQRLVGWMKVPQTTCLLCRKLAPTSRTPLFTRCIDCSDGFGSVYRHQRSELCLSLFVRVCVSVRAYLPVFLFLSFLLLLLVSSICIPVCRTGTSATYFAFARISHQTV